MWGLGAADGTAAHIKPGRIMKKIILALLMASVAQAQTSTTNAPAGSTAAAVTATSAAASTGSNAASLETEAGPTKRYGFKVISENYAPVNSLKDNSEGATSTNSFGFSFKPNKTHAFEIRARTNTDFYKMSDDKASRSHVTNMADPTIHYNYSSNLKLLGSDAVVFANRYYVPISKSSQDKKSNGFFRSIAALNWDLNPRVSIELGEQTFLFLNKAGSKDNGSDAVLSFVVGPKATYNFNDKWNTYYNPYIETATSNFTRGNYNANRANNIYHEAGLNIKAGIVEINPCIITTTTALEKSTYEDFGSDSGTSYNLNVVAAF